MKRYFLLFILAIGSYMDLSAKPKVHLEGSIDVSIGRKKYNCTRIWLCIENPDIDIHVVSGMIANGNNGLVLDEDGSLSIAVNIDRIRTQDPTKYKELSSGSIQLDSDETLPQDWLNKLGYKRQNIFRAGTYQVTVYQGYYLIHL